MELVSNASFISFNSIPQDYSDLFLMISVRSNRTTGFGDLVIEFNNSTSGYSATRLTGNGSTAATNAAIWINASSELSTSNIFSNGAIYIHNYNGSSFKTWSSEIVSENNDATSPLNIGTGQWADTRPIQSISIKDISGGGGTWLAGSSVSLYGVRRGSDQKTNAISGGVITTSGGYTIHTFNASGTFVADRNLNVEYLVVGGGGGGGDTDAGGGGAGGLVYYGSQSPSIATSAFVQNGEYQVLVGAGGARQETNDTRGFNGNNSLLFNQTAIGGGGGGLNVSRSPNPVGLSGGSGGGSGTGTTSASGQALQPTSLSGGFGNIGGLGSGSINGGGGGGGAAAPGRSRTESVNPGHGGFGLQYSISGSSVYYADGGGGGHGLVTVGGSGRGGAGQLNGNGSDAQPNSGSGGGGGGGANGNGGAGGSGIVIIRYLTPQ